MKTTEVKTTSSASKSNMPFFSKGGGYSVLNSVDNEQPFFNIKNYRVSGIQSKLTIGKPNDTYELEADAVADRVVNGLNNGNHSIESKNGNSVQRNLLTSPLTYASSAQRKCDECQEEVQKKEEYGDPGKLQKKPIFESNAEPQEEESGIRRKCAECENEEVQKLQKKSDTNTDTNSASSLETHIVSSKGSGSSLPETTKIQMESSFGADFSNVRIHNDSNASQMSSQLHAQAFTHGSDIYFNQGNYNVNSRSGQHLLAHELTHTVQQGGSKIKAKPAGIQGAPQVQLSSGAEIIQMSVVDDALSFAGSLTDCITFDLDEAKRCGKQKAQQVALHIPGYRALRVILGSDPITGEGIERNGKNFIEAALDIMPGGILIHQKLIELHQLDAAAAWIDLRIASLVAIVNTLFGELSSFWNSLGISDFTSPMDIIRRGANIVLGFINRVVSFAVDAAASLLGMIKDFLIGKIVDFIKEQTPAYPLLTVILGKDPITNQEVERNGTNILNALLELGGEEGIEQRRQMQETGSFQKVAGFIDEGIAVFSGAYLQIRQGFSNIWNTVSIENLVDPIGTFTLIYNEFSQPIGKIWDFVKKVGAVILQYIKEVLLKRLADWAKTVRGYTLITVIIGKDPFTGEAVPRTVENIIHGFMGLMDGGEAQFEQMKESGVIARMTARINAAVETLNMTPAAIIQMFIDLWNSFSLQDLINPIAAFQRIIDRFGEPIARLVAFVWEIIKIVIEVIMRMMNFPFDLINNIITKALQAIELIKRDPIGFLKNILRAIKQGFIQFFDNIVKHLLQGLVGWLTSELKDAGVAELSDLSLKGVISWVLEMLGISMEVIWKKLGEHPRIGPQRVAKIRSMINTLEGIWTFIKDVQERGVAAIWDKIKEQLSNLWDTVLNSIKNWIMEKIITAVVTKLLSMLDPTGIMAVINSAIAIYKAVQSFIKYLREMLEIVNSFVEGIVEIASGNIQKAADYLERTMARGIPIVIGFLANQVGLGGIGKKIGEMIGSAREMVDKALTWLVNKAVDTGMALLDKIMAMGKAAAGAVLGWLGLRKEFKDSSGGDHSIYFEGSGTSAELFVASYNPRTIKTLLNAAAGVINLPANSVHQQSYQEAVTLNNEVNSLITKLADPNNANADKDNEEMNKKLTELASKLPPLMIMVGGTEPPPLLKPAFTNGVKASSFEVSYLKSGRTSGGSGANTNSGASLPGWPAINQAGLSQGSAWVKMHLLTEQLGGPAFDSNLTPARGPETNLKAYSEVEKPAIDAVADGKTIWYKITIGYHGTPDQDYANSIEIEFGPYKLDTNSNQWEKQARGTDIDGTAVGEIFSQSPQPPDFSGAVVMPNINDDTVGRVKIQNLALGLNRPFAEFIQDVRDKNGPFSDENDMELKLNNAYSKRTVPIDNFLQQISALKTQANKTYKFN